ncbi:MAG: CAP domain-containing protein [Candidatus Nitrosopolaris sp.]
MVQKHIVISMIAPVAVAGILIMVILASVDAQESNSTENAQQQSNSTENTQESSNAGNATSPSESMASNTGNEQQESNNTGNATSTGAPENATSPSGSTANNTASPSESMVNSSTGNAQQSNNTGNGPTSQESSNTRNARQENNGTENAIYGVPCPYNANITCAPPPEPLNGTNTNTTSTPYVVNKNSSAYLVGYNDAFSYNSGGCSTLSNTSSVQNDCSIGYVDGIDKLGDTTFQQSADFVKGMLAAHNRERHLVGVTNDLVWDKELAASAKAWAEHLSPAGQLIHDYGNVQAENIADDLANGPTAWINEKNDYHGGTCASGQECGHYLNMVDPKLTAVGCGTASDPHPIVVCRYHR